MFTVKIYYLYQTPWRRSLVEFNSARVTRLDEKKKYLYLRLRINREGEFYKISGYIVAFKKRSDGVGERITSWKKLGVRVEGEHTVELNIMVISNRKQSLVVLKILSSWVCT